jgi:hypothetical protein
VRSRECVVLWEMSNECMVWEKEVEEGKVVDARGDWKYL